MPFPSPGPGVLRNAPRMGASARPARNARFRGGLPPGIGKPSPSAPLDPTPHSMRISRHPRNARKTVTGRSRPSRRQNASASRTSPLANGACRRVARARTADRHSKNRPEREQGSVQRRRESQQAKNSGRRLRRRARTGKPHTLAAGGVRNLFAPSKAPQWPVPPGEWVIFLERMLGNPAP